MILHIGLASATKAPEFMLDQAESDMLAAATVNVLEQFDVRPDPKIEAIFGLIVAAGTVYGPRVYSVKMRHAREKEARKTSNFDAGFSPDNVVEATFTNSAMN